MKKRKRIGMLTGGGDCPGINAVIRAVSKTAYNEFGMDVIGFNDGFEGLILNSYSQLDDEDVSDILTRGGTILGASNRADPFQYPVLQGDKYVYLDRSSQCVKTFHSLGLECLIAIGGDGTMAVSHKLIEKGLPIIGVPKTIDNDVMGTDVTFGFDTASQTATDAIDRIHTTAQSHHRVMVVEVMGRHSGWLALASGLAGGGDIILLPEFPYQIEAVCDQIKLRNSRGKKFSIVVVGEGAKPKGGEQVVKKIIEESPEKVRLGGISYKVAQQIEDKISMECRVTILGHLLRGGTPTSRDRLLATVYGCEAARMAHRGDYARMVVLNKNELDSVPIEKIAGKSRLVTPDHRWIKAALGLGLSLGVPEDQL
ncbi:MAG: ATP-dependent 6-phosphofructokinase [Candidatus Aminicenantes bacterium]